MQIVWAFFVLATGICAWKAWRRNPLYSRKSTVKAGTVWLLGSALAIGLARLVANHSSGRSPAVLTLSCAALLAAIILGLYAASRRITEGPADKTPRRTKPGDRYRRKLYPWLLGFATLLLLLLVWAALVAPSSAELPLVLAALVLAIGISALGSLYFKAKRSDYAIDALMTDFWVHWQYAPGESEAWLGPAGLLYGGEYTPWLSSSSYLVNARAELVPALFLALTFEKFSGRDSAPITIRVPVPASWENEVEGLEGKLRAHCPKAQIHLGVAHSARLL
jgi:hypothetical protein